MARNTMFGDFIKSRRLALGKTLRKFCLENGFDPGNVSKLERGKMAPPQQQDVLDNYAKALELDPDSEDWNTFHDLAATEAGRIPKDILSDEELLARLPILFRTIRGQKLSEEKLRELIEAIRKA